MRATCFFAITKRHSSRWNAVFQGIHCINLGFGHLRGLQEIASFITLYCINLGFGHLRGLATPVFEADVHCINLGFGHLRRPSPAKPASGAELYRPGIWTPSKTISNAGRRGARLYQPGIWTPSRTKQISRIKTNELYQPGIWMSSRTHHPDPTHDAHCINLESGIETRTTR